MSTPTNFPSQAPDENNLLNWITLVKRWGANIDVTLAKAMNTANSASTGVVRSVFITYHNNAQNAMPTAPTGDGTTNGWHTTPTGDEVWMSQKVAATATDGTWNRPMLIKGADGAAGVGGYTDFIFKRSATQPATPTGTIGIPSSPVGWYDAPPTGTDPLWMSTADKDSGGNLTAAWSTPVQTSGAGILVKYSADGATGWTDTFSAANPAHKYMRQSTDNGITWSAAMRIVGEDGAPGVGSPGPAGTSITWKGELSAAPTNPANGWRYRNSSDGKTYEYWDNAWYMTTMDGAAAASLSVQYSANGSDWHDTFWPGNANPLSAPKDLYMRQKLGNGEWSLAMRIVAENGAPGDKVVFIFKRAITIPSTPVGTTPTGWTNTLPIVVYGDPSENWTIWVSSANVGGNYPADMSVPTWSSPARFSGSAGSGLNFRGTFSIPPHTAEVNDTYKNSLDGSVYICTVAGRANHTEPQSQFDFSHATWAVMTTDGNHIDFIFRRSDTQPTTPTTDDPTVEQRITIVQFPGFAMIPSEWFDAPPDGTNALWMSKAEKTAAGILVNPWSTPIRIDGLSVVHKGTLAAAPNPAQINWTYKDSDNGIVYICTAIDGSGVGTWTILTNDGNPGTDGTNGSSIFICYCDYPPAYTPTKPANTDDGSTSPWYTAANTGSVWMCQKVAPTCTDPDIAWSAPILINPLATGDPSLVPMPPTKRYVITAAADAANPTNTTTGTLIATLTYSAPRAASVLTISGLWYEQQTGTSPYDTAAKRNQRISEEINRAAAAANIRIRGNTTNSGARLQLYIESDDTNDVAASVAITGTLATDLKLTDALTPTKTQEWVTDWYAYSDAAANSAPATPTTDGTTTPWSAIKSSAANWKSTKRATTRSASNGSWSIPIPLATTNPAVYRYTLTSYGNVTSPSFPSTGGTFNIRIGGTAYSITGLTNPAGTGATKCHNAAKQLTTALKVAGAPADCIYTGSKFMIRSTKPIDQVTGAATSTNWAYYTAFDFDEQDQTYATQGIRGTEWAYPWYCHADNAWDNAPAEPTDQGNTSPWYNTGKTANSKWQARKTEPTLATGYWWDGSQPI